RRRRRACRSGRGPRPRGGRGRARRKPARRARGTGECGAWGAWRVGGGAWERARPGSRPVHRSAATYPRGIMPLLARRYRCVRARRATCPAMPLRRLPRAPCNCAPRRAYRRTTPHAPALAHSSLRTYGILFSLWLMVFTAASQTIIVTPILPLIGDEL